MRGLGGERRFGRLMFRGLGFYLGSMLGLIIVG